MLLTSFSDKDLVALLNQGDENAFRELYQRHWYAVYTRAVRKTGRKDIGEEMAQHIFEMLWEKKMQLKIENIGAYLNTSLRNLVIDYVRKNLQEANYLSQLKYYIPLQETALGSEVQYHELTLAMHHSLDLLPEKTRKVFMMSRFEQLTIAEIAHELELSDKAIEYHLSKALSFLRKNLREFTLSAILLSQV